MAEKQKKPEPDDPEQSQRFIETAKKVEADGDGTSFDEAMTPIAKKKRLPQNSGKT
jgi:hypothetical protein